MLLRKHVNMPEKFSNLNLPPTLIRFLKRTSISLVITLTTRTLETLLKTVNFAIVHMPEGNAQVMEMFVMFSIKGTIAKFATNVLLNKYMKLKRTNLMNPPTREIMNF